MKNESLREYMKHIKVINKEVSEYSNDEKGIKYIMPTAQLIVKIDYLELTKEELQTAKFKEMIDKNKDYKQIDAVRVVSKENITKKEKDRFTLVDSKIKAYAMWNVTNGLGIKETCVTKEEALELYDEINKDLVKLYE